MRHPTFPLPRSKEQVALEFCHECAACPLAVSALMIRMTVEFWGEDGLPEGWLPERMLAFADWIADEADRAEQERKDWEARN